MCDLNIHDELINLEQSKCPFCNELLIPCVKDTVYTCCDKQNIENTNCFNTCLNCGLVYGYTTYDNEYIDFHANIYKIRKKSVYNRFYYIENCLYKLCLNGVDLTYKQRAIIYKIFDLIDTIIPKVNENRKRLISINYILKMLFKMMEIPYDVQISKSTKTVKYYKNYWDNVMNLIGDKIQAIIDQKTDYKCYPISA